MYSTTTTFHVRRSRTPSSSSRRTMATSSRLPSLTTQRRRRARRRAPSSPPHQREDHEHLFHHLQEQGVQQPLQRQWHRELQAALHAIVHDQYVTWRNFNTGQDCVRVGQQGKCFCGHTFAAHMQNALAPCTSCRCAMFHFIPSKAEDIGQLDQAKKEAPCSVFIKSSAKVTRMQWRKGQIGKAPKKTTWVPRCHCGHAASAHHYDQQKACIQCRCDQFRSAFHCAVCGENMEAHHTVIENEKERLEDQRSIRDQFLPFAELPDYQTLLFGENIMQHVHQQIKQTIVTRKAANRPLLREPLLKKRCHPSKKKKIQGRNCPSAYTNLITINQPQAIAIRP